MGNLFNINGPFYRIMSKVADAMILTILWLVSSVPLITLGASCSALYFSVFKVIREDADTPWRCYWRAFRSNFKQGTIIGIPVMLACGFWAYFLFQRYLVKDFLSLAPLLALIALCYCIMWLHYILTYIARFSDSFKGVLLKSLILCISEMPRSLLVLLCFVLSIALLVVCILVAPLLAFFMPVLYALLLSLILEKVYGKYIKKAEEAAAESADQTN